MSGFSILITVYFKEKALFYSECLESLYNQTLKANEIVIVHDGPVGVDLHIVEKKFKDKLPLQIIELPTNLGSGLASNEGLKHCSYELIARMDSDDICCPNRFELQYNYFKQNPDIDFLGGSILEFENGDINSCTRYRNVPLSHEKIIKRSMSRNPMNHVTVMYKKSVMRKLVYYRSLLLFEDYYLWVRALQQGYKFANLSEYLVHVRCGLEMISRRKGIAYIKNEFFLFNYMYKTKYISLLRFTFNMSIRLIVRMLPNYMLGKVYKLLRSKKSL